MSTGDQGFAISKLQTGAEALLNGRPSSTWNNTLAEYAAKAALELSEDYKHPLLETSGPVFTLTPLLPNYDYNSFLATADQGLSILRINSLFIMTNGYTPLTTSTQQNTGFQMRYKTINDIEVLINVPGQPTRWTRHNNQIWIGCVPDQAYYIYARYQREHPFPNRGTGTAADDLILFENSWQDVMEYAVAHRAATDLNLNSKAADLFTKLYGDTRFLSTAGVEGTPGLIFQRTSQQRRDQGTYTKSFRLKMGRV